MTKFLAPLLASFALAFAAVAQEPTILPHVPLPPPPHYPFGSPGQGGIGGPPEMKNFVDGNGVPISRNDSPPTSWTETQLKGYIDAEIDARVDAAVAKALAARAVQPEASCPNGVCAVPGVCGVAGCIGGAACANCGAVPAPGVDVAYNPAPVGYKWDFDNGAWVVKQDFGQIAYQQPAYYGGWQAGPTYYQSADDGSGASGSCGAAGGKGPLRRFFARLRGR